MFRIINPITTALSIIYVVSKGISAGKKVHGWLKER